jgi:hypothetical protein
VDVYLFISPIPEPGHLPLCVVPRKLLNSMDAGRLVDLACQQRADLAEANHLFCGGAYSRYGRDFLYNTVGKHFQDTAIDPFVEFVSWALESYSRDSRFF